MRLRLEPVRTASLVGVCLVLVSGCSGGDPATAPAPPPAATTPSPPSPVTLSEAVTLVRRDLRGLPQDGLVLGQADAPIEIIEYAALDCEACAAAHKTLVPTVISRFVRAGEASLEFRALTSTQASLDRALGAFAASSQKQGWQAIQLEYARRTFGSGSVPFGPAETPAEHAAALRLDVARWQRDRESTEWALRLEAAENVWKIARWGAAPVFLIRRRGSETAFVTLTQPKTLEEFVAAFAEAKQRAPA